MPYELETEALRSLYFRTSPSQPEYNILRCSSKRQVEQTLCGRLDLSHSHWCNWLGLSRLCDGRLSSFCTQQIRLSPTCIEFSRSRVAIAGGWVEAKIQCSKEPGSLEGCDQ